MKKLTIGLIGNPNSGKTTLFNQLTGARQRVGNWAGVTVERKEGLFTTTDHQVTLVDLPGTYSLTTISSQTSLDEQIACHYILSGDADLLINVVDASNLERNLYLTLQLLELGIPCIVALNMLDIAEKQKLRIDVDAQLLFLRNVEHVERHDAGNTQLQQLQRQVEVALEVGGVDHVDQQVRVTAQNVVAGNLLIERGLRRNGG